MPIQWKAIAIATLVTAGYSMDSYAGSDIHLTVNGVRNDSGKIYVLVFDNSTAFNNIDINGAIDFAEIKARPGTLKHVFKGLGAGPFAIMLFHDENGDGDLNMDGQTALEGYGLSGSKGADDLPGFDKASFKPGTVSVKVHYQK